MGLWDVFGGFLGSQGGSVWINYSWKGNAPLACHSLLSFSDVSTNAHNHNGNRSVEKAKVQSK